MHARAPLQPAASKPSEQPWKWLCLEAQPQHPWEPKGSCSWMQLPFRDHSPAARIAQQCWISPGSHYTLPSTRITVTEGSFEVLCPDSARDISRGVFPTAASAKEHKAWNGGREEETCQCQFPAGRAAPPRADVLQSAALPPTFSWQSSFTARLLGFRSYNRQEQKNWMFQAAIHQHNFQLNLCLPLMGSHNTPGSISIQHMTE